jgi:hypothetical protein
MISFRVTVGPSALCSAAIPLGTQPPANGRLRRWKSTDKIYPRSLSKTRSNQGAPVVVGLMKMKSFGFGWSISGDSRRHPRWRLLARAVKRPRSISAAFGSPEEWGNIFRHGQSEFAR